MDLREMHYLLEIANTGHMTQAANNLFISQPALSKSLRKVENELGTELFYRDGNRLLPTDTGRIVIEKSSEILQLAANMNDAVDSTKNLKRGKVTLGCPSIVASLYLSELLIEFQRIYPEISFHLIEACGAELTRLTASGEIDLAIVMRPIYSDLLNEIPIVKNQIVACAGQSHPWFSKSYVTISDFRNMPFITFDEYMDLLADGEWERTFTEKPEVFTREEKRAWLNQLQDVALGSDAFFPFGDNIERAHKSGVKYVAQPGGSVRDDQVIETCNKYGMTMCFTGIRLFHH